MADPNIPVRRDDIRYEDRGGVFVLVDPANPDGRDVAAAWSETPGRWRWRPNLAHRDGSPYPTAAHRDAALTEMLETYAASSPDVASRLGEQRSRFSFGAPQIFRA